MGLLPVVLSKEVCLGGCLGNERQTLYQELPESELRRAQGHALDALLPLVPHEAAALDTSPARRPVQEMQVERCGGLLGVLRLVWG